MASRAPGAESTKAAPRRWRKLGDGDEQLQRARRQWRRRDRDEHLLRMGPLTIVVWVHPGSELWGWDVYIHDGGRLLTSMDQPGAPLAQCKADAIAAVERWMDSIR